MKQLPCKQCETPTLWLRRGLCGKCYKAAEKAERSYHGQRSRLPYRVSYDDARRKMVGKKRGPGLALPKFATLEEAREKCRELNAKLNAVYGAPRAGKRFPIYFVESTKLFMLTEGDDE